MTFLKSKLFIAIIIFIAVIIMVFTVRNQPLSNLSQKIAVGEPNPNGQSGITLADLSKHNTQSDCWVAYNSKVYDVTSWLPNHPGTAGAISPYCGTAKEFQTAFEKKHRTKKVDLLMQVGTFMGDFQVVGSLN